MITRKQPFQFTTAVFDSPSEEFTPEGQQKTKEREATTTMPPEGTPGRVRVNLGDTTAEYLRRVTSGNVRFLALVDQFNLYEKQERRVGSTIYLRVILTSEGRVKVKEKNISSGAGVNEKIGRGTTVYNESGEVLLQRSSRNHTNFANFLDANQSKLHEYTGHTQGSLTTDEEVTMISSLLQAQLDCSKQEAPDVLEKARIIVYEFSRNSANDVPQKGTVENQISSLGLLFLTASIALAPLVYYYKALQKLMMRIYKFFSSGNQQEEKAFL